MLFFILLLLVLVLTRSTAPREPYVAKVTVDSPELEEAVIGVLRESNQELLDTHTISNDGVHYIDIDDEDVQQGERLYVPIGGTQSESVTVPGPTDCRVSAWTKGGMW